VSVRQTSSSGGLIIGGSVSGGTPNRVLFIDASGNLADDADFLFDSVTTTWTFGPTATPNLIIAPTLSQFNSGAADIDTIITGNDFDILVGDAGANSIIIGGSNTDLLSALAVQPTATTDIGIVVKGLAAQSSNLFQAQISTGVAKTLIDETGLLISEWNAITNTSTDGFVLQNTTDALVGAQNQWSPRLRFHAESWNTTGSASVTSDWSIENQSTPGSSVTVGGLWTLKHSAGGAAYNNYITVRSNLAGTTGVYTFNASNITNTSGTPTYFTIAPTYNQSSTGGGTDLYVNRTENNLGSGTHLILNLAVAGTSRFNVTNHGSVNIVPRSLTTGTAATGISYTGPSHSTLSALAEFNDVYFSTATHSYGGTGTVTDQRTYRFDRRTYGSSSAVTITNASTLWVEGAADDAGSVSITNSYTAYLLGGTLTSGVTNGVTLRVDPPSSAATINAAAYFSGDVGIMKSTPAAYLNLGAGTATAGDAPLKFDSGTSLTVAVAGAMEFTTDDLFFTITTGPARKRLIMADPTDGLTSGRLPFATTNGRLTDDADMTFSTDTLTVTKVKAGGAAGFISSDGSAGATGTFTTADLKTCTVKDGIITSIV